MKFPCTFTCERSLLKIILITIMLFSVINAEETGGTRTAVFDAVSNAKIQGLGGCAVATDHHLASAFENPALLATLIRPSLSISHAQIFIGDNLYSISAGMGQLIDRLSFAAKWTQLAGEETINTQKTNVDNYKRKTKHRHKYKHTEALPMDQKRKIISRNFYLPSQFLFS